MKGTWKDITKEPQKTGLSAPFKFGEAVIGEQFKLEAYKETKNIFSQKNETHKMGEIIVIPKSNKEQKITKVVLFNRGARDVNKANYTDRLIARAYCVGMFNKTINFHLWEDDAKGSGHNPEINKNNRHNRAYPARVNIDGIAEAEISLAADQNVLKQIANKMMMQGDKTEGKYHEFYVTASYDGKILNANQTNVDVVNPDHNKQQPKPTSSPTTGKIPSPSIPKPNTASPPKKDEESLWEKSKNFLIDAVAGIMDKIEKVKSPTVVNSVPTKNTATTCLCREQYKDLIWGEKVSCEFRKKVVEIAKRLGKDPNLLMAGMALETGRTFSPTAGKGTSYVGLIQFGDDAAKSVETTREKLLSMTAIQQLDYVEKYLSKKKDKINTLTDFYLSILMPVDVGKGNQPNHIVFDNQYPLVYKKDGKLTDLSKSRHYGYRQNPSFLHEEGEKKRWEDGGKKKYDGVGKTYIWEIEKSISKFYEEGKQNKSKNFECKKTESPTIKPTIDKGTWNIIITEHYTGSKCTHIEKTPIRNNCRKGKIEVYDHNQKIVLTFNECLLEGVAGEDRMLTNSDVPYGEYQINNSTPFYSSNDENKISYGPNPRLVFEPIKENNDEASKSGRSAIRIHGGRQEGYKVKTLKRTQGCIRVWDDDAKALYDWWIEYRKKNPNIKPGKVTIKK